MITTIQIDKGITLRCIRDTRFKQGCFSIQFVRPMDSREVAVNALLPAVLLRGCEGAPDLRDITLKLDDLYGASVGALVRRIGDYQATGFYCNMIDDRFALSGDRVLEPMLEFVGQLLRRPVLEKGVFLPAYVESEKKNLISTIQSQLNNKRAYAAQELYRYMCKADTLGIPRLGREEWVREITPESAYVHYETILRESPVALFYVGSEAPETVAEAAKVMFAGLERNPKALPEQTAFHSCGGGSFSKTMEVSQGKLAMGFVTPITLRSEAFAAMQVCNAMFGGGMTSKLFMQVREKQSLCYDIGSGYQGSKGVLTVQAGIDCEKEDQVKQQVLFQLQQLCQGNFTQQELSAAKEALRAGLEGVHDAPGAMEGYYGVGVLSGLNRTPEQYQQQVAQVTGQQVMDAAKTLQLDTTFFLKGVGV